MVPGIALIAVIALVYTTPWDNYLVYRGVWGYGANRVLGVVWFVPIEEYAFFILQTILTGLLLTLLMQPTPDSTQTTESNLLKNIVAIGLAACSVLGLTWILTGESYLYLGLIVAWAGPVLLLQWLLGHRTLRAERRAWLMACVAATVYLSAADAIAIKAGTWFLSDRFTTGFGIGPLPVEEFLFFLVTNLLVVWGLLLYHRYRSSWHAPDHDSAQVTGPGD